MFIRQPNRSAFLEVVEDEKALQQLKSTRHWIGGTGNIILDIDEDYFGVDLPAQSLLDSGLKWDTVTIFDFILRRIFCPTRIDHEPRGNRMLRELISSFIRLCRRSVHSDDDTCASVAVDPAIGVINKLMLAYWTRDQDIFCAKNSQEIYNLATELTMVSSLFSINHLRVLVEFGFCFETSPASRLFRDVGHGKIKLCMGFNTPNDSVVVVHKPDAAEVRARTAQLRKMLEIIDARHRPSVVTLCRSVRDGYTPKSFFSSIEANILGIFKDLPGHYDVVYDENLYGGKGGWPDRHKKA